MATVQLLLLLLLLMKTSVPGGESVQRGRACGRAAASRAAPAAAGRVCV